MTLRSLGALAVFACSALAPNDIAAQGAQATPPRWKATVNLTIGGENATDDTDFGQISGLAVDATGRIFVADRKDSQIRVFSSTGAPLGRIGRDGSGPMEFKKLATVTIAPDGRLWARDEGNARMQVIDVSRFPASVVKNVPLRKFDGGSHVPITFSTNGEMIDEASFFDPQLKTALPLRVVVGANGDVLRVDTLAVPTGAFAGVHKVLVTRKDPSGREMSRGESYFWQPHGPAWLRAFGPGGVRADAVGQRYEVTVYGANGQVVRVLRRDPAPVPLSARERQKADSAIRRAGSDLPFGVPKAKPPIVALRWSQDGQLWVERSVADGQPREADVYDANGKWIAIAEWPNTIDLLLYFPVITGKTAIVVNPDANDIERVVRLTFR